MNSRLAWRIYLFGIKVGLFSLLKGHWVIGAKQLLYPVGYWRFPIFPICVEETKSLPAGSRILDIGSPKLLSVYLSSQQGHEVYATDICNRNIETRYAVHHADYPRKRRGGAFIPSFEDARELSFPDEHFDAVYSLSVIEHIPDDGDSVAMNELRRVLKPGATAIVEVPLADTYGEDWVDEDVYEREASGRKIFYQRRYDAARVIGNLVTPSGMKLTRCVVTGERSLFVFEKLRARLPGVLYAPFMWAESVVSFFHHRSVECNADTLSSAVQSFGKRTMNITLVLQKS